MRQAAAVEYRPRQLAVKLPFLLMLLLPLAPYAYCAPLRSPVILVRTPQQAGRLRGRLSTRV